MLLLLLSQLKGYYSGDRFILFHENHKVNSTNTKKVNILLFVCDWSKQCLDNNSCVAAKVEVQLFCRMTLNCLAGVSCVGTDTLLMNLLHHSQLILVWIQPFWPYMRGMPHSAKQQKKLQASPCVILSEQTKLLLNDFITQLYTTCNILV